MKHDELAWVPMCRPDTGGGCWFFQAGIRDRMRDARNDFAEHCGMEWKMLRKEGWRIVRVRISHHS